MFAPERIAQYRLEGLLGSGGMGQVYRAWDEQLERWVALKLIRSDVHESATARARFRREARMVARLGHPAIVRLHHVLPWEKGECLVLELVEGQTLAELLRRGPLLPDNARSLFREIAGGLAYAHARGVIHRDLKPENVMVTAPDATARGRGRAKILDFGLAKHLHESTAISAAGTLVGTLRYMSPEQANGLEVDARSDLFSLGVTLYEALTGDSPFHGDTPAETVARLCTVQPRAVRELRSEVSSELSTLVSRLLEKSRRRRPPSAAAVERELAGEDPPAGVSDSASETPPPQPETLHASTVGLPPAKLSTWPRRSLRRARRHVLLVAGLFVLLLCGAWIILETRPVADGPSDRGRVHYEQAKLFHDQGDVEAAREELELAMETFRREGDLAWAGTCQVYLAHILAKQDPEGAGRLYRRALENLADGDLVSRASALNGLANLKSPADEALDHYRQAARLYSRLGEEEKSVSLRMNLGVLLHFRGDLATAEHFYEEARAFFDANNDNKNLAVVTTNLGEIALARGDLDRARGLIQEGLDLRREAGERCNEAYNRYLQGRLAVLEGNFFAARGEYDDALQTLDGCGETRRTELARLARAEVELLDRDSDVAPEQVRRRMRQAEEVLRTAGQADEAALAQIGLARLELIRASPDDARLYAEKARMRARQVPHYELRLASRIVDARLRAASGRPQEVKAALAELAALGAEAAGNAVPLAFEARLAAVGIELAAGPDNRGCALLEELRRDARERGFHGIGKQAAALAGTCL